MPKINLDKYYTPKKLAKYCIDVFNSFGFEVTETIEPSAGNGSFSLQIPNCIAYDIEPGNESIIKQDFLELNLPYKKGRLLIGNPPFGTRNTLSVKFYKQACKMGDYIAFILPVSQYNNNQQMYEFDLIHSEVLPVVEYSEVELFCCFNIFRRPESGLNKSARNYKLKDVTVLEYRRGKTHSRPTNYAFRMRAWGRNLNKEVEFIGQYVRELYIVVNNVKHRNKIIDMMKNTDWNNFYPNISTNMVIPTWRIYKYLKEQIPELN